MNPLLKIIYKCMKFILTEMEYINPFYCKTLGSENCGLLNRGTYLGGRENMIHFRPAQSKYSTFSEL